MLTRPDGGATVLNVSLCQSSCLYIKLCMHTTSAFPERPFSGAGLCASKLQTHFNELTFMRNEEKKRHNVEREIDEQ